LGVTPVSLSRIRNRITKKWHLWFLIFCYRFEPITRINFVHY
jgi:hypothetical protein